MGRPVWTFILEPHERFAADTYEFAGVQALTLRGAIRLGRELVDAPTHTHRVVKARRA